LVTLIGDSHGLTMIVSGESFDDCLAVLETTNFDFITNTKMNGDTLLGVFYELAEFLHTSI